MWRPLLLAVLFSILFVYVISEKPSTTPPPPDNGDTGDQSGSTTAKGGASHGDGPTTTNPPESGRPKGKDGGKGNPRNKHVESLAETIARYQASLGGNSNTEEEEQPAPS